ncbi:MAG TPA: copper resistance protein CopC [Acidimicrobiia bacterium]|nr:copper resistance protein CopC [Acidimicrobiia bacterium]
MRKVAVGTALVLGGLLYLALPAAAHANLVATSPADSSQSDEPPARVTVTFDEPVALPTGALRVFDQEGNRVDRGDYGPGTSPEIIFVTLDPSLSDGWYIASWRILSEDGHPLQGAFTFEVGEGGDPPAPGVIDEIVGGESVPAAWAGLGLRWLVYASSLIAAGAAIFQLLPGARSTRPPVRRLIRRAAATGIVGSLLAIPTLAAEATGLGMEALVSAEAWSDAVTSPVGMASLVRTGGLAILLIGNLSPAMAGAGFLVVVAAEVMAGHTLTAPYRGLVMLADGVHVGAAALWMGGLVGLVVGLRSLADDQDAGGGARTVAAFSSLVGWTILALALAGLGLAWAFVGSPAAATSTTYGWVLVAKTVLVGLILLVARYNRSVLVPAIVSGQGRDPWRRLGRTVRLELGGLLIVAGLTAVLVNLPPAIEVAAGAFSTTVDLGEGQSSRGQLNLVVDPARRGSNEIHVYLLDQSGFPASSSGHVILELSMPVGEIGPLIRHPNVAGPGHWILTGDELSIAGTWEVTVRLREGFEEFVATVPVTVR